MNTADLGQSAPPPSTEALKSVIPPTCQRQLQINLVVSTYQAGKVIVIRADQGVLNTAIRR